jgi:lysine-specific demethylase 3
MTSLFAQVWFCRLCGRELCGECYDRVCDITRIPIDDLVAYKAELKKRRADIGKGVSLSCNKRKEHTYAQFTPITRFEKLEIATAIMEMKSMSLADKPTQTQSQVRESAEVDPASEPEVPNFVDPCPPQGPDEPEAIKHRSHDTPFFNVNELKLRVFRKLWAKGKPLVVYGLGSKLRLPWTPEALSKKYGTDECSVSDCETGVSKQTTVAEFFEHFGDYRARKQVWKLKVWHPPCQSTSGGPAFTYCAALGLAINDRVQGDVSRAVCRLL